MVRPKSWSEEVEEAYRFQLAGYRDEHEYKAVRKEDASIVELIVSLIILLGCYGFFRRLRSPTLPPNLNNC